MGVVKLRLRESRVEGDESIGYFFSSFSSFFFFFFCGYTRSSKVLFSTTD